MVGQPDPAGDAVGAVLGDLDRRLAIVLPVDLGASLDAVDREAERPRRAVADRADDLIHAASAGRDERLAVDVEHRREAIGAEPRVLADAAVVEQRDLHALVRIASVRDALRVLAIEEPAGRTRSVADRL